MVGEQGLKGYLRSNMGKKSACREEWKPSSAQHHLTKKHAGKQDGERRIIKTTHSCAQMLSGPFPLFTSVLGELLPR